MVSRTLYLVALVFITNNKYCDCSLLPHTSPPHLQSSSQQDHNLLIVGPEYTDSAAKVQSTPHLLTTQSSKDNQRNSLYLISPELDHSSLSLPSLNENEFRPIKNPRGTYQQRHGPISTGENTTSPTIVFEKQKLHAGACYDELTPGCKQLTVTVREIITVSIFIFH